MQAEQIDFTGLLHVSTRQDPRLRSERDRAEASRLEAEQARDESQSPYPY